jgi:hypothetical protein
MRRRNQTILFSAIIGAVILSTGGCGTDPAVADPVFAFDVVECRRNQSSITLSGRLTASAGDPCLIRLQSNGPLELVPVSLIAALDDPQSQAKLQEALLRGEQFCPIDLNNVLVTLYFDLAGITIPDQVTITMNGEPRELLVER